MDAASGARCTPLLMLRASTCSCTVGCATRRCSCAACCRQPYHTAGRLGRPFWGGAGQGAGRASAAVVSRGSCGQAAALQPCATLSPLLTGAHLAP